MRLTVLMLLFLGFIARANTQGSTDTLVVGFTTAPPFIVQNDGRLSGINIWLWEKVARDLELNYVLRRMEFRPMLEALEEGNIDVSINPLTITSARSKTMEFTHSYYAANATVAIAEVSRFKKVIQFVRGFLDTSFIRGLGILLVIIVIFGMAGWYFERRANPDQFRKGYKGLWDGLWWSVVTLTTVGYGDKAPRTSKGKLAALLLMFTGLLFISGLTASIASNLTVNQLSGTNQRVDDFKDKRVGTVRNTGTETYLKENFFRDIRVFNGVPEGLSALKKNRIEAFLYDEPLLRYRIKRDSAFGTISILPIKFDTQFYAFGLPKDRIVLEQQISQKILEIVETDQWQVLLNEYGLSQY